METKTSVVAKVLAGFAQGEKITLEEAIKRAEAVKATKGTNNVRTWRAEFKVQGVVTKENKVVYVAAKPNTPAPVVAPVVVPAETVVVPTVETQTAPTA